MALRLTDDLLARAKTRPKLTSAIVHPVSASVLSAVAEASEQGLIEPVLVGPLHRVERAAKDAGVDIARWRVLDAEHSHEAAERACALAASGEVRALMKGSLHSDELLHAVLANPKVRSDCRLSHIYLFDDPDYHKPFMVTDGAINIAPTLAHKADIVRNAAKLFRALGGEDAVPKVAVLAAVETVNAEMPATIDAACLSKMAERGQLGACIVDGPLALDRCIRAYQGVTAMAATTFAQGLVADGPAHEYAEQLALYGQFVGDWSTQTTAYNGDGSAEHSEWDVRFAWVLEGRAIQDLWITPPRSVRRPGWREAGNRYSTTLRMYDPSIDAWHILWLNPPSGAVLRQLGRKVADEIIQMGEREANGELARWVYRDIRPDAFHWCSERSGDNGVTWRLIQEMRAVRIR